MKILRKSTILWFLLLSFIIAGFSSKNVKATETEGTYKGDSFTLTYVTDGTNVAITDCNLWAVNVVIPKTIDNCPVISIGASAFQACSSLTSVDIPDSVTSIGTFAFKACSSLTSVDIPDSVTSIGTSAFAYCSSLTSVDISNSVTSIGYEAFYNCLSLTSVDIPKAVTSIGYEAFYNCLSLTKMTFYGNVNLIYGKPFGFYHSEVYDSDKLVDGFTVYIHGEQNSLVVSYCNENQINTIVEEHSYGDYTITKSSTCGKSGTKIRTCSICGNIKTEYISPTGNHSYGDWTITKYPTCWMIGKQQRICSVCGNTETQTIPATDNHDFISKVIYPPTVFQEGIQANVCSVCGRVENQTVIPKLAPTITLSKTKVTLKLKNKKKSTTIKVSNLANGDSVKSWKSTKKKVATVNSKGKIKAKKKGKTNIIVTLASGKTAVVKVTVK